LRGRELKFQRTVFGSFERKNNRSAKTAERKRIQEYIRRNKMENRERMIVKKTGRCNYRPGICYKILIKPLRPVIGMLNSFLRSGLLAYSAALSVKETTHQVFFCRFPIFTSGKKLVINKLTLLLLITYYLEHLEN